ncbi:hypothetical protein R6Z07M_000598 [Ovis aries]
MIIVPEEETGGQESINNFGLVVEDGHLSNGGTKSPQALPQPDTQAQPSPGGGGSAPIAPPAAGHWRVRKTRGVVGLNGSVWSWAQAQTGGAVAGGRRCGTLARRPALGAVAAAAAASPSPPRSLHSPAPGRNVAEVLLKGPEMQGFGTHFEPLSCLTLTSFHY